MGYALEELGPDRCRQIAEGLFKVEKVYGEKLHGFCPIHGDKKSASFVYHTAEDWYKCKSCQEGGDLVKLWCEIQGMDSRGEGFKAFKAEYVDDGLSRSTPKKPNKRRASKPKKEAPEVFVPEDAFAALPPLPPERVTELRRLRGWSPEVIELLELREFADRGKPRIAMPIRDDEGRLCNVRLYQPGADQYKVISWYDKACLKCGGQWKRVDKKKICSQCAAAPNDYGRTRLYPPPSRWKPGLLWVMEGESDLICALSHGLNAVTQTAGCGTWRDEFSESMDGRDVVIAYDADKPGFKGALQAAQAIAAQAKSVRVIRWPEMMGGPA